MMQMQQNRVNVLGVGVSATSMDEAVCRLLDARAAGERGYVCVTGAHGVMESQRDEALRRIHNASLMTVPDGMPTVWMGREYGFSRMSRVYGPDLMLALCAATSGSGGGRECGSKGVSEPFVFNQRTEDGGPPSSPQASPSHGRTEDGGQRSASESCYLYPSQDETGSLDLGGTGTCGSEGVGASGSCGVAGAPSHTPILPDPHTSSVSHFLYGATEETLTKLKENLERKFPGIQIVGTYAPPFRPLNDAEEADLQKQVTACRPDFFWVGLSTPKQERFMYEHCSHMIVGCETWDVEGAGEVVERDQHPTSNIQRSTPSAPRYPLDAGIMLGVGAAFDIHAGNYKDTPKWIQDAGLQWLHRLCKEPRRLWRRYLWVVPGFLWLVFLQVMGLRKWRVD